MSIYRKSEPNSQLQPISPALRRSALMPSVSRYCFNSTALWVSFFSLSFFSLSLFAPSNAYAGPRQPSVQTKQLPPAPPSTPPPNRTRSGGSLGGESLCVGGSQNLLALVPVENPVFTAADHPTLLFYVPFGAEQVTQGEFSLLVGPQETSRLYQTRFTLPSQPGIVSVTLPSSAEPLQENGSYHWYFKLYCTGNTTGSADLQVDGWIQRVASTPERQHQIAAASPEIWYDALAQVATGLIANPTNSTLQTQWRNLLQQIDLETMETEPLVGTVQLID